VDLSGSGQANVLREDQQHPLDILISGFSEQILRFIAERGDNNQLNYVEHIDIGYGVKEETRKNVASQEVEVSPWWKWLEKLYVENKEQAPHYPNIVSGTPWRDVRFNSLKILV
jgi:telomerase protein component 1